MRRSLLRGIVLVGLPVFLLAAVTAEEKKPAAKLDLSRLPKAASTKVDYVRDIQPLLARCYTCHGPKEHESGLRLHHRDSALAGGDGGAVIVPGHSAQSRLVHYVAGLDEDRLMPPEGEGKRLSAEEVGLLRAWIDQGAKWPDEAAGLLASKDHWAYKKPVRPALPKVMRRDWPVVGIDYFVLARLEKEGLSPSAAEERAKLIRRLSYDLIGLPPTIEEVDAFLKDDRSDAYEKVVDRLLRSPRYGERWAAPWLDLARYADTQGYEKDGRRTIWRYRDWVIDALNRDLPFDRFTIEQLAGDLLPDATTDQLIATAFHRNTMTNTEGGTDDEEFRVAAVVDRVNTTFAVWQATTINCCQCHSHKYDPVTQREFYRVLAFFNQSQDRDQSNESPTISTPTREQQARMEQLKEEIAALREGRAKADTKDQKAVAEKIAQLENQLKSIKPPTTPILRDLPENQRRKTHVMIRGSFLNPGGEVSAGVPSVLNPLPKNAPRNRLGFARWLVDEDNPLTARVAVNRLWGHLFGKGIVSTSEDFGTQGEPPSHPRLLDWLATELVRLEWSQKKLLKTIVMSATYRQSSRVPEGLAKRDPRNQLLARGPRMRLSAEMIRDGALAAAGLLSDKMYGPSVMPPQPGGVWQIVYSGDQWATSQGEDKYRRGLYTFWRRTSPYPAMTNFGVPSREFCVIKRSRTNTPLEALTTLNDPAFFEAAQGLARRVLTDKKGAGPEEQMTYAFRRCLSRRPTGRELQRLVAHLDENLAHFRDKENAQAAKDIATRGLGQLPEGIDPSEAAAWTVVGNVLLNLDETLTK